MKIQAVKLYKDGFMLRGFALSGEGAVNDPDFRYRSSVQNFLIDTGSEVILVDTGLPKETPDMIPDDKTQIYLGSRILDYVSALKALGYAPEQVTKILVTHKHEDHTGELRSFPNAKIYVSETEADAMNLTGENVVRVKFESGAYHTFDASEKIVDGVYMLPAKGHTTGNSIIVAEDEGLFFMLHGDITYTDEALFENKLSVANEDMPTARETLNRVRAFIEKNPTVYCSTHTPLGYENLEARQPFSLTEAPKYVAPVEVEAKEATGKYVCSVCGKVYDPAEGDPEHGIPAGTPFEELPDDWKCPRCKNGKEKFNRA